LRFLEKNGRLWYNFQNFVPKIYTATLLDVVMLKCRKICSTGNLRNRAVFGRNSPVCDKGTQVNFFLLRNCNGSEY